MKHLSGFKVLNRTHEHRKALYKNMVIALFRKERIKTTKIKAKEIRRVAEKIITRAKNKTIHNVRIIGKLIEDKKILMKLFDEIAPRYKERKGGYTRIYTLNRRKGDGALMSYLELVEEGVDNKGGKKKKIIVKKEDKQDKVIEEKKNVEKETEAESDEASLTTLNEQKDESDNKDVNLDDSSDKDAK